VIRFRMVLMDEAHFLKNMVSFWGMGAALLGAMSERIVPLSGTPYNNGPQDVATLMAFIDPTLPSANKPWWIHATKDHGISSGSTTSETGEGESSNGVVANANANNTNNANNATRIVEAVKDWRSTYMLRRDKDVLRDFFTVTKTVQTLSVPSSHPSELAVYMYYEGLFLRMLDQFTKMGEQQHNGNGNGGNLNLLAIQRRNDMFKQMMAVMTLMRMSLIHPLVPQAREFTIQYSPSRRHLLKRESRIIQRTCVFCATKHVSQCMKEQEAAQIAKRDNKHTHDNQHKDMDHMMDHMMDHIDNIAGMENWRNTVTETDDLEDADLDGTTGGSNNNNSNKNKSLPRHEKVKRRMEQKYKKSKSNDDNDIDDLDEEDLIPLPGDICRTAAHSQLNMTNNGAGEDYSHYIHQECLDDLVAQSRNCGVETTCPRCADIEHRSVFRHAATATATTTTQEEDDNDTGGMDDNNKKKKIKTKPVLPVSPVRIYCQNVKTTFGSNGFQASAKMERLIEWVRAVPRPEKMIIYSFFKAGLDLVEGILVQDYHMECARFDGDMEPALRHGDLQTFQTRSSCRVLLASIQSGGTGLNITQANHAIFLDRWFNPCVHHQAEDRCYRIGQTKNVQIAYCDNAMTVDEVMCAIHELKSNNATILLADGTSMGVHQSALSYSDLSGRIGCMMRSMGLQRRAHAAVHGPDAPHPPVNQEMMLAATSTDFSAAPAPAVAAAPVKADPSSLKLTLATSNCCGDDDVKVKPTIRRSGSGSGGSGVAASELILKARMASAKLHSYLAPTNKNNAAVRRTTTTTTTNSTAAHTNNNKNMIHASLMVAAAKTNKTKEVETTKSKPSLSKTTTATTNNITASTLTSTCSKPQAMNVDGDSDSDDDSDFDFFEPSVFAKKK
jgi:hypothetical protein